MRVPHRLSAALLLGGCLFSAPARAAWVTHGHTAQVHNEPISVVLPDGRWFIGDRVNQTRAEIYDPKTDSWKNAAPYPTTRRLSYFAPTSKGVLFVGFLALASPITDGVTYLYDPVADSWRASTPLPTLTFSEFPSLVGTPLADGRVLLVLPENAAIFDPTSETWNVVPLPPNLDARVAALHDGGALLIGDVAGKKTYRFDAKANAFTSAAPQLVGRIGPGLATLDDGRVVVAGGATLEGGSVGTPSASAEIYDPATNAWTMLPPMTAPHEYPTAINLGGGRALFAVGFDPGSSIYDMRLNQWLDAGDILPPHSFMAAALLGDVVYLTGDDSSRDVLTYTPQVAGASCARPGDCASGWCVDGVCCNGSCTDACSRCDTASSRGTCTPVLGPVNHCSGAMICAASGCVPAPPTTCSTDHRAAIAADGTSSPCAPYLCDSALGACRTKCASTNECDIDFLCDVASSTCAPAAAPSRGGCAVTHHVPRSTPLSAVWVALALCGASRLRGAFQRRSRRGASQ